MQDDLISCWTCALSSHTRAVCGWSSMQTTPACKAAHGWLTSRMETLQACTAPDCIKPCQHWFNCIAILMPFSSLLVENWIIPFLFPSWGALLAHISASPSGKSTYKDSITASSLRSESLFSKPFSPRPSTRLLAGTHTPADTSHQLPEQSQHPQYRLPKIDWKHILSITWQSWVKVRSSVGFISIQDL